MRNTLLDTPMLPTRLPVSTYLAAAPHVQALGRLDLGFGRTATIWRNRDAHIFYDAPDGHVLSFYLRGGSGTRRVDPGVGRRPIRGWQGAFCLMPQGQSSEWEVTDSFDFIHLFLPDQELRRAFTELFDRDARLVQPADLTYLSAHDLTASFLELAHATQEGDAIAGEEAMQTLVETVLSDARCSLPGQRPVQGGIAPHRLRHLLEYIETRLDQPIRLRDLAALHDLSEFHLQRSFRASCGVSPRRWILHRRISRAREMIAAGQPLAQVAAACGFDSQSHLTRNFQIATGTTPGRWREQSHNKAGQPS